MRIGGTGYSTAYFAESSGVSIGVSRLRPKSLPPTHSLWIITWCRLGEICSSATYVQWEEGASHSGLEDPLCRIRQVRSRRACDLLVGEERRRFCCLATRRREAEKVLWEENPCDGCDVEAFVVGKRGG